MKKIKYFLCVILTALTAVCLSFSADAEYTDSFDIQSKCSISVSLIPKGTINGAVEGAEVTIYRIADIEAANGKIVYKYRREFEDCGYDLDNPDNPRLAWWLYTYAVENRVRGTSIITNSRGEAVFNDLDPGLYLGAETMSVKNYCDFSPFVLSLPMAEDDRWIYNVSAAPKIEIERFVDITVNKFWNDGGKNRPESIKVQLISDEGVYDTVTLTEEGNWSYTWQLIPFTESWTVKEEAVPGNYTVTYEQNGFTFNIYNTRGSDGGDDGDDGDGDGNGDGGSGTVSINTSTGTNTNTSTITSISTGSSGILIQTGQLKWPVPVLACCGAALLTAGIAVRGVGGKYED